MAWNDDLTGAALQIASCDESPLRVMAGPGTGKSFSMKRRVQRLLEEGANPQRILAITFTRTASEDMIKELSNLNTPGCTNIRSSTLHAFCYSVLIKNDVLNYLNRYPRPLISFSQKGVLKFEVAPLIADLELIGDFGNKREMCRRIRAFEAAWARLQSDIPGWPNDATDNAFHRALMNWLSFHKGMLIGELVPLTLNYFRNNSTAEELSGFDHVVVDEYQDLNKAEQVLIDLVSSNGKYFIIGDEDQSIYSFRFAHPEGIKTFHQTHPNTHDEPLNECRRCPRKIVEIADYLIRQNHDTNIERRLNPRQVNPEGQIHNVQWNDLEQETEGIGNYIYHLISEKGYSAKDILILCSRRLISYMIFNKIKNLDIAVHSYYYDAVLEDINGQKAYTLLSLLSNIEDRVSLRFWLGFNSNNWLARQYSKIKDYAINNNLTPRGVLDGLVSGSLSIPNTSQIKHAYENLISELEILRNLNIPEVFNALFPDGNEWALPIRNAILEKITESTEIEKLHNLVRTFISQPETPDEGEFVKVMSLHKSKGLTSKVVIIPALIQGLLPRVDTSASMAEQELELKEQRRLFYVAITRATDLLLISSIQEMNISLAYKLGAKARSRSGLNKQINMASQFITELGPSAPTSKTGTTWIANHYE